MARGPWVAPFVRRLFWLHGAPDLRLLQLGFALLIVVSGPVMLPIVGWSAVGPPTYVALALTALSLLVVFVVAPRVEDEDRLLCPLAFVDLALVGITGLQLDVGTLPLVVVPALWLGAQQRWRGALIAGAATLALVVVPALVVHGNDDGTASQVIPLPLVAILAALAMAVGLEAAQHAQADAERALADLASQRRSSEAIVGATDVGLLLLDCAGTVLQRNGPQADLDALVYPQGRGTAAVHVYQADGTTPVPADELPSVVAASGAEFDDYRIWIGEAPSGRRAISVSARSVCDETGRRTGTALAYKDITDLMRALTVKDEFVGLVSHELRTPLTSIYGYVCMLSEREDLPPVAARQVDVVARSTDRLRILVDDLIEATQVAGGGLRLARRSCDLAEIVRHCVQAAGPHAERAAVELRVEVPDTIPARLDATRIAQVLDNLISNAIKYTAPGGWASVAVSATSSQVAVEVRDNGIGIRADDLGQLFTRFFRTGDAAARQIPGAGLGLAISRTIVESHGGRIEVASEPGQGSAFRVLLPRELAVPLGSTGIESAAS